MMMSKEYIEQIAKQKVEGSSPFARSIVLLNRSDGHDGEGAVPKRLRERSAKPRFVGSNPTRASIT